jgi:hypothetical protein
MPISTTSISKLSGQTFGMLTPTSISMFFTQSRCQDQHRFQS